MSKFASPSALAKTFVARYVRKEFYSLSISEVYSKKVGKYFTRRLADSPDIEAVVCADAQPGPLAYTFTDAPIICYTDCVVSRMFDYYWRNCPQETRRELNGVQQKVLDRCDAIAATSDWARQSIVDDYGIPAEKVRVIPLGANVDEYYAA